MNNFFFAKKITLLLFVFLVINSSFVWSQNPVCATPGSDGVQEFPAPQNSFFPGAGDDITVSAGATSLTLDPIPDPFQVGGVTYDFGNNQISKGDLLLIIQIQGASINYTNTSSYGSGVAANNGSGYTNLNNVGRYEYMVALNDVSTAGGTLQFKGSGPTGGLLYTYENKPPTASHGVMRFQVIRLMQYSDLTLTADVVTTPWNGKAGGLIAIDVAGTLDFNGRTINASMTGFRGGYMPSRTIANTNYSDHVTPTAGDNNRGSSKGEGIAGVPRYVWDGYDYLDQGAGWVGYPGGNYGRGAPGNAGGGGNVHNAGGGGGGNGGNGGAGGYGWPITSSTTNNAASILTGGRPGIALPSNVSNGLLFMGGGGGGGDANNAASGVRGGVGGGIVIITANKVTGNGVILANGGRGEAGQAGSSADGAGGGGAGGSVFINVKEPSDGSINIQARGGNGGHSYTTDLHGPGGGGGGGIVYYNANGVSVATNVAPGEAGRINNGQPIDPNNYGNFPDGINKAQNGAQAGQPGISAGFSIDDLPPYLEPSAYCYPELTITKWRDNPTTPVLAGSTIVYRIQITNNGGGAKDVRIHDPLPAGFQFISATIEFELTPGVTQPLNNIGTIETPILGTFNLIAEEGAYIEMTVQVPFNTPVGTYHNGVQVGYLDPTREVTQAERVIYPPTHALPGQNTSYIKGDEAVGGSNYSPTQVGEEVIVIAPELGILKTLNTPCVEAGGNTYTIVLLNSSAFDLDLQDFEVIDNIHPELTVTNVSVGAGWTYSNIGNTYTFTLSTLAAGSPSVPTQSSPITITVVPNGSATQNSWSNTATMATPQGTISSTVILYKPTTTIPTAQAVVLPGNCDTGIYHIQGNVPTIGVGQWQFVGNAGSAYVENPNLPTTRILGVQVGQTVTVVWTIQNSPCNPVSSTPLSFTRPEVPTATISGGGTLCAGAPITSAQNITITLTPAAGRKRIKYLDGGGFERTVVTNTGATSYTFTPAYTGTYTLVEIKAGGTSDNPEHSSWGVANCPGTISGIAQVNVVTEAPVGGSISYSGGAVCVGSTVPTALTLSGHVGTVFHWEQSTNGTTWTAITGTTNLTSFSPTVTTNMYYRAVISGVLVNGNPCFPNTHSTVVYVQVRDCNDLAVTKTVDNTTPDAGTTVVFTVTANNLRQINASGVTVYDKLPNGYTYQNHVASAGTYNPATGVWNIGNLNAGQSRTLTITALVNQAGQYTNKAVISCNEQEINYSNNTAEVTPDVNCDIRNVSPRIN